MVEVGSWHLTSSPSPGLSGPMSHEAKPTWGACLCACAHVHVCTCVYECDVCDCYVCVRVGGREGRFLLPDLS